MQINKFFVTIVFLHYCQNAFADPIWPEGRSLKTLD